MKKLTKEQEQALEVFKKTKNDPKTISGFFYSILDNADPIFKSFMENKAAVMLEAGSRIGKELANAEKDPKKKAEVIKELEKMLASIDATVKKTTSNVSKKE